MKGVINMFMNASEIKIKRRIEGEMFEQSQVLNQKMMI
jgi:hypothetical protein